MRTATVPSGSLATSVRKLVGRPSGTVEAARWLFALLFLLSIVLTLPAVLVGRSGGVPVGLGITAAVVLAVSCVFTYARQRSPVVLDLVDSAAFLALALACFNPEAVIGLGFAAVWFRSLYGSGPRALLRCVLIAGSIAAALPLWTEVPGHLAPIAAAPILGAFPFLFLTAVVGRQLSAGFRIREQAERHNAALASLGTKLLGLTHGGEIGRIAVDAASEICAANPGLRVLKLVRSPGSGFHVETVTGDFQSIPQVLPDEVLRLDKGQDAAIGDTSALTGAVGEHCGWVPIELPEYRSAAWLLAGAPQQPPAEAVLALRSLVNQVALARRNSKVHAELSLQARSDALTGLATRSFFHEAVAAALERGPAGEVSVLFIDLDDFKTVNDELGHLVGDQVLQEIAARLQGATRSEDLCARLGGDEFAVLVHAADPSLAARLADRLVQLVAVPVHAGASTTYLGASVGVATADSGSDLEHLIHHADVAMYSAKGSGKGCLQVFGPELLDDRPRTTFEQQLAGACAAGQLVVHYQPVLEVATGRCTAVEALVRWQHPTRGLLAPGDFIERAERTGAILDIGAFVLRQACADWSAWNAAHPGASLGIHVNVSARQLDHAGFTELVLRCLSEFAMSAKQLVLEITETVVLNSPVAVHHLQRLAEHGVAIAIDDFGTGYSALTTLRSLPVDIVKIDKSFVAGALHSRADQAIIEAIVQMSNRLQLRTVAEGVERWDQERYLESVGVDGVQGFLHFRPADAAAFGAWLGTNLLKSRGRMAHGAEVVRLSPRRTG